MVQTIRASTTASILELKRNPMATVAAGAGLPVAILNRNEPTFYCVPALAYEALLERLVNLSNRTRWPTPAWPPGKRR